MQFFDAVARHSTSNGLKASPTRVKYTIIAMNASLGHRRRYQMQDADHFASLLVRLM